MHPVERMKKEAELLTVYTALAEAAHRFARDEATFDEVE